MPVLLVRRRNMTSKFGLSKEITKPEKPGGTKLLV